MRYYADQENLHTRIYAMRSRLLSLKDYNAIVRDQENLGENISEAHDYFKAKETVFREQITMVISLAEATRKYAPLFIAFLRQYEANNVKLLLSKTFGRQTAEQWYDIGPYAILDRTLIDKGLSLNEIKTIIAGTYLEAIFNDISSYERLEIQTAISCVRNLYAASEPFLPESRKVFRDVMLRRVSVIMMIWLWRLKQNYHWDDRRAKTYLDTIYNLNLFEGNGATEIKSLERELTRHLEQPGKAGDKTLTPTTIEYSLESYYYGWISSMFHKDFHSISCVVAYLFLLSYQIRNMLCIIDGQRFGLSPERILERIIGEG